MLILHDPLTLRHRTVEFAYGKLQAALECPERIEAILTALKSSTHTVTTVNCSIGAAGEVPETLKETLRSTHEPGYIKHLSTAHQTWVDASAIEPHDSILPECFPYPTRTHGTNTNKPPTDIYARAGYYAFDMSTGIMADTFAAAVASADLALQGVNALLSPTKEPGRAASEVKDVLCLCRPPGHHCDTRRAGGFCYINNAIIAAAAVQRMSASGATRTKIGILDIDFHHGNGTQDYFYDSQDVCYVSIHGEDEFPYYTGGADEIGAGDGEGFNLNLPLKTGSSVDAYLDKLDLGLQRLEEYSPAFLIVSLGFDTFHLDPIGNFKLYTENYEVIAQRIRSRLTVMPALILLEGGYVVDKLGENVLSFLAGWESVTPSSHHQTA